jgi:hypothetical protein
MDALGHKLIQHYDEAAKEANFLRDAFLERTQLYGALICLFIDNDLSEYVLDISRLKNDKMLLFTPSEDKTQITISIVDLTLPEIVEEENV